VRGASVDRDMKKIEAELKRIKRGFRRASDLSPSRKKR
jgi:hypothetical protein